MRNNSLHDRVPFAAVPTIIVNSPERPSRTLALLKDMRNEQTSTNGGGSLDLDLCVARTAAVVTPPALETRMEPDDPEVRVQDESLHPADSSQPCSFNKPSAVETLPTLSRHRAHARSHTLPISHSASSSTTGSASASASSRSPTPTLTSHTSSHSFSLLTPSSISPASVSLSHVSPSTAFVSSIAPRHAARRSGPRTHTTKPAPTAETVDKDIAAAIDLNNIDNMSSISTTRLQELRAREIPSVVINPLADTGPEEVMVPLLAPTPLRAGTSLPPPPLSRSSSAASTASANGGSRGILRRIFIDRAGTPSQHLSRPTFPPMSLTSYSPVPHTPMTLWEHVRLAFNQLVSFGLSTFFLLGVVMWAMAAEALYAIPNFFKRVKAPKYEWDDDRYWRREGKKISKEPRDYARQIGLDIENQTVETEDGYYLRMHKVVDPNAQPRADGRGGFPVLILHGLFQSSGSFITSEDRSLAFWLARKGYQVYLGNTRGIFDMGHRSYSRADPRFWDWTIRDLAMFDLPAMVDHVCQDTGYDKIAFMGHSQGNGLTFISLSLGMVPNLGKKLSVFIALAPAVYAGPLTTGFPFTALSRLEWHTWKRFFGVLDFIPLMRYAYDYCPARLFAFAGYIMFAFLFSWTDANWLKRRKTKMFRFTPTPVSSASIFWWCGKGGFADRKCTLDDSLERWYDDRFPPLSIYHGGRDFLVLTEPLLERLEKKEKDVKVIKVTKLDKSEHCDFYWAAEAVEWAYESFVDDIESTRPRYPEEEE